MHHKLQSSSSKNHGKNSVVRKQQTKTNRQTSLERGKGDRSRKKGRGKSERSSASSSRDSRSRLQKSRRERPDVLQKRPSLPGKRPDLRRERPSLWRESRAVVQERKCPGNATALRCEVPHSAGFDPTGERAFPCGARAEVICATCGPMCAACAEQTFCQRGVHKLGPLPESEPEPVRQEVKRPITPVIYVELRCPTRCRVRVALPQTNRLQSKRKCPVCKAMASTKYLAHGFTRRSLPFHEVWTDEEDFIKGGEPSEDPDFKRRVPWDGEKASGNRNVGGKWGP